jgi:5'-nucleotidase
MKINTIVSNSSVEEGFADDMKSAFRAGQKAGSLKGGFQAGQKDYIARRAAELGISPQQAAEPQQAKPAQSAQTSAPGTGSQPDYHTPTAPKQRVRVPAGSSPVTPAATQATASVPKAGAAAKPAASAPATPAAPAKTTAPKPTFDALLPTVEKLSKAEQSKLLVHLLQSSKSKISAAK